MLKDGDSSRFPNITGAKVPVASVLNTPLKTQVKFCLKMVLECRDEIFFGITTSFCEIITARPLLDQM